MIYKKKGCEGTVYIELLLSCRHRVSVVIDLYLIICRTVYCTHGTVPFPSTIIYIIYIYVHHNIKRLYTHKPKNLKHFGSRAVIRSYTVRAVASVVFASSFVPISFTSKDPQLVDSFCLPYQVCTTRNPLLVMPRMRHSQQFLGFETASISYCAWKLE